jgi:hypothetical protein
MEVPPLEIKRRRSLRGWTAIARAQALPASVAEAPLGQDGILQNEMLLSPFLTTTDCLRLSETASFLTPFRGQLRSFRFKPGGGRSRSHKMVQPLIRQQRRLRDLTLARSPLLVPVMTALAPTLRRLRVQASTKVAERRMGFLHWHFFLVALV